MSTYSQQVPDGLKPHHCERPGGEYSDVPIRYIMTQIPKAEIVKTSISLPDNIKLLVTVYSDGNAEMYIRMLRDHEYLVTENESKKNISDANAILKTAYTCYKTTKAVVNPNNLTQALLVTQEKDWRSAQKTCRIIVAAAFSLFRRMLAGPAKEQWDMIDNEVHSDATHTDLQGLTVRGPRKKTWATLDLCIEKHKLFVFQVNAADVTRQYLLQGIRKPDDVRVRWFIQRVATINRDLSLMPCLALNTRTSKEVVPTNVPFNGVEMCDIIIRSLPQDWQTQYHHVNGQENQTKLLNLLIQLEVIEKAMDQKRKDKDSTKDPPANPGQNGKSSEKRHSIGSSESYPIPKKQQTDKFCNRCREHGGKHNTHNTSDCNRYKADGSPNTDYGARSASSKKGKDGKDKPHYKKWREDYQQLAL